MDFSSLNPDTSNALSLAARRNDARAVKRLLKKLNPSCIDNRGWTALHEAAAEDSYESLVAILKHRHCRPLAETHEGHTALYLACRHRASLKTIRALLDSQEDIANYGSTECVTPLHMAAAAGRIELMQLLIDYGAIVNVTDFDGDTPMHDAVLSDQPEAVTVLLYAGGDAEIKNEPLYTPFHLACYKGSYRNVKDLYPFISDINMPTLNGDTPLILAVQSGKENVVLFLLEYGADPNIRNENGDLALNMALFMSYESIFKILLRATDTDKINKDIVLNACKPHFFRQDILEALLQHDFGPEFFDYHEPFYITLEKLGDDCPKYITNAPLNSFFNIAEYIYNQSPEKFRDIFYLCLMRGLSVDPIDVNECPPLAYIHYSPHSACFAEVFEVLQQFGCNVDHCTAKCFNPEKCIPDAFLASLTSDPSTLPIMLPFSLYCEPGYILQFANEIDILSRIPPSVQEQLLTMIDSSFVSEGVTAETVSNFLPPLKHLCRLKIRSVIRNTRCTMKTTKESLEAIEKLKLPPVIKKYLRYL